MRDFYKHQDNAFRRTARLLLVLTVALAGTVTCTAAALTYGIVVLLYVCSHFELAEVTLEIFELFVFLAAVVACAIGAASWFKIVQLRDGGKVIALDLGGFLIEDEPHLSPEQRRLLNVVQEMAISASIPAPAVYELPNQNGINAFAAGFTYEDAVIGVTRGCMTRLSRDQLQGVIAHEFGHILNGDMKLNLRLVGALHGVLMIPICAEGAIRTGYELATGHHGDARDAGNELALAVILIMFGVMLWPIGLVGSLFGMLTMSATSRQREYLADAFAVQFTRNPNGISDALKVLAGHRAGSRVNAKNSMEASHFFFAPGVKSALFATHPPLADRITRLDPSWDGVPIFESEDDLGNYKGAYENSYSLVGQTAAIGAAALAGRSVAASEQQADEAPSTPSDNNDDWEGERPFCQSDWTSRYVSELIAEMPEAWIELVADADGAQAMLSALWVSHLADREAGLRHAPANFAKYIAGLVEHVHDLSEAHQSLLLDLSLESIDKAEPDKKREFLRALPAMLSSADPTNLTQWSWVRQIRARTHVEEEPRALHGSLKPVEDACEVFLSWLCHCGTDNAVMADYAFQRAVVHLGLKQPVMRAREDIDVEMLDVSIDMLSETAARCRRQLLIAMGSCVAADRDIANDEALLVRGACAALRLPVPALLPGQAIAPGV